MKKLGHVFSDNKGKINTNFHDDEIPKEAFYCICLSVILNDSVF